MDENLTLLNIIKSCRTTEIIWKQELKSTKDVDKLYALLKSYCEAALAYCKEELTFKEFHDSVTFLYYNTYCIDK